MRRTCVERETTEQEPAAAAPGNMYYGFGESGSSEFELVLLLLLIGGRFDPTRNSGALRRA